MTDLLASTPEVSAGRARRGLVEQPEDEVPRRSLAKPDAGLSHPDLVTSGEIVVPPELIAPVAGLSLPGAVPSGLPAPEQSAFVPASPGLLPYAGVPMSGLVQPVPVVPSGLGQPVPVSGLAQPVPAALVSDLAQPVPVVPVSSAVPSGDVVLPGVVQSGVGVPVSGPVLMPSAGVPVSGLAQPVPMVPVSGPIPSDMVLPPAVVQSGEMVIPPAVVQSGVGVPVSGPVLMPSVGAPASGPIPSDMVLPPAVVQSGEMVIPPAVVQSGEVIMPPGTVQSGEVGMPPIAGQFGQMPMPGADETNVKKRSRRKDKSSKKSESAQPPQNGVFLGMPQAQPGQMQQPAPAVGNPGSPEAKSASKQRGRKRAGRLNEPALWIIEIAVWVVAAIILSTLLRLFVFQMFLVPSTSMDDTLQKNDRIAALKVTHFQRGDIVVFADPGNWLGEPAQPVSKVHHFFEMIGLLASTDQQYLVKRVIGLPGDDVKCCSADGHLTVNGVELDESSYLMDPSKPASGIEFEVVVPEGRVFVMGDNRYDSADSRYHLCQVTPQGLGMNGFVPEENIVGPVRAVILPFGRTGGRPVPTSVFSSVPSPQNAPPSRPFVNVTSGLADTCHS